ncbi:hypothetical protein BaRGS_00022262 [Batillaria attramentaria]|uniref:Small-subunit processome Utp21 domain-containing protein n=1 Tax=Batillaria attramentaria TaxID=370345 RepID=A0ABD0KH13_9CAEN
MPASKIFAGYRALGFVSTHVPLAVRYHNKHKENYVVTSVGRAFHVYNCSKLGIVSVSDIHPDEINVLAVSSRHIFTASGNVIRCFDRGRKVIHTYEGHESEVTILLPLGRHLMSVDIAGHVMVWDVHTEGVYLTMEFKVDSFTITAAVHPNTYKNKVLLGSRQGVIQLWNVFNDRLLYTFTGWGQPITVLEQAPAVDVVAVGLGDGRIIIHNIKFDETVMKFTQDWGPVTSISFRTDGHPTMVTGSAAGHIAFWDLETRTLKSQELEAHRSSVSGLQCLPNEPLMVTSAADNTLKVWIFDQPDGGARLLRMREGHAAPPNYLHHYGNNGQSILSAGQDSTLRLFSTVHDKHNRSLGRGSFNKAETKRTGLKLDQHLMPPITTFAAESNRESDWDNVVACHRGLRMVTTWSTQRCTMGKHKLDSQRFHHGNEHRNTTALAVDVSSCGNYAVIGYSSGHVDLYNLQSGKQRGSYGKPSKAHECAVRGVAFDALNQLLVTAGADGVLKFWKFKCKSMIREVKLSAQISSIVMHRESSMLAAVLEDFSVAIVDIDTRRVVRSFTGHTNTITGLTFSPDARWLITSSMDATVCTWNVVTGRLIDCFAVDSAVTSLSMSPTGDFLATSHVDDLGVYLWSNVTLYSYVALPPLPEGFEPQTLHLPATAYVPSGEDSSSSEEAMEYDTSEFKSPEQISDELVTLSLLPTSRWLNLLNLDVIKMRNKPKVPPKVPKSAPFFLPTVTGLQPTFAAAEEKEKGESQILNKPDLHIASEVGQLLGQAAESGDYDPVLTRFKSQGASAIDSDIRSLEGEEELEGFLDFVLHVIDSNKDFEIMQAYLGLFLKIHGEDLSASTHLADKMEEVLKAQSATWKRLQFSINESLCLVNYLRSAVL